MWASSHFLYGLGGLDRHNYHLRRGVERSPLEHDTTAAFETRTSDSSSLSFEPDTNPDVYAVLRVECLHAKSLKRYTVVKVLLELVCLGTWVIALAVTWRPHSQLYPPSAVLFATTILATVCGAALCTALLCYTASFARAAQAQQIWSARRRRYSLLQALQLSFLAISNIILAVSSGYGRQQLLCQLYKHFCIWSEFWIWTGLVGVLMTHLTMSHAISAWTDGNGRPASFTIMDRWVARPKSPHALVLDAPWRIHLPKLILWAELQAALILQLATSLSGRPYAQVACDGPVSGHACAPTEAYQVSHIMRIVGISCYLSWLGWLLAHGLRDMQKVPYSAARLGRLLMSTRSSSHMGLKYGIIVGVGLLHSTIFQQLPCSSCLQNWLLLASILQGTCMLVLSAWLFQPLTAAPGMESHMMQVWLQYFAWTESSVVSKVQKRTDFGGLQDKLPLSKEPMFCFETAVKLLYWCGLAYEYQEGRQNLKLSEKQGMQLYGLQHLHVLRDAATATKALVAWGPTDLVIAFRGTANIQNAFHDTKAWLVPHSHDSPPTSFSWRAHPALHSGFRASWHGGLKDSVTKLITQTASISATQASHMRVRITGHSLGGVLAVIAAMDIADLLPWASLQVYTVGAPRPGNRAFSKLYDTKAPDTWHIINERDPVPQMAKFGAIYSRPGHRVLINSQGDMLVRPTPLDIKLNTACHRLNRHYLNAYRTSLVEVIRCQLRQAKFNDGLQGVLELAESIDLTSTLLAADLQVQTPGPAAAVTATVSDALRSDELLV